MTAANRTTEYDTELTREDILDDIFYHSQDDVPFYLMIGDGVAKREHTEWRARKRRARALNKKEEGADFAATATVPPGEVFDNYTQIMTDQVEISGTAEEIALVGIDDVWAEESQQALEAHGTDIEYALLRGVVASGMTREMGGALDTTSWGDGSSHPQIFRMNELDTQSQGQGLTNVHIRLMQQACYVDGEKPDTLLVNVDGKFDCAAWVGPAGVTRITRTESRRTYNEGIDIYEGDLGKLEIYISRDISDDEAFMFRRSLFQKLWLRRTRYEDLSKIGDARRGWWLSELTLRNKKPWSTAKAKNITR